MSTVLYRRPPRQPGPQMPRGELLLESPPPLPDAAAARPRAAADGAADGLRRRRDGVHVRRARRRHRPPGSWVACSASRCWAWRSARSAPAEVPARPRSTPPAATTCATWRRSAGRPGAPRRSSAPRCCGAIPRPRRCGRSARRGGCGSGAAPTTTSARSASPPGAQRLAVTIVPPETKPVEDLEPMSAVALRRFVRTHSSVPMLPLAVQLRAFSRVVLRGERATRAGSGPRRRRPVRRVPLARRRAASPWWRRTEREADWDWVKWLPHAQDERRVDAAGPQRLMFESMCGAGGGVRRRPGRPAAALPRRQAADHARRTCW